MDASTSASVAAYLTSLTYALGHDGKFKTAGGTLCSWNAFSRIDLRVEVRIPGGVEAYGIDERGEKRAATEELWQETYLCGMLRALLYPDDPQFQSLQGCRKLIPLPVPEAEERFLSCLETLFFHGPSLGAEPVCQVPSLLCNYLVSGLKTYLHTTGRFDIGVHVLEKLVVKDPEVNALLASIVIEMDEEVRAVRLMHEFLLSYPMNAQTLLLQSEFLTSKSQKTLALQMAQRAVNAAPSEFLTWRRLAQCHIDLENYSEALLCLNSCPMFTPTEGPLPRMPSPAKAYLPIPTEAVLDDTELDGSEIVDPTLMKLPAPALRGTFKEAYDLLTQIVDKLGWDALLRRRSLVFVMEEEYRNEKTRPNRQSTDAVKSDAGDIPKNGDAQEENSEAMNEDLHATEVLKPEPVIPAVEAKASEENDSTPQPFKDKRLCERWLDNLFMVMYEDFRVYTIWRAELAHFSSHEVPYRKSCLEHEILADLALRLHHPAEAMQSFRAALGERFSRKAWRAIVSQYPDLDMTQALEGVVRLIVYAHRWYEEYNPGILQILRRMVDQEGPVKIKSRLAATKFAPDIIALVEGWIQLLPASD